MKSKFRNLLVIILTFLVCSNVHAEKVKYTIGASLPLSGRLSYIGEDIRRGLKLAVDEFSNQNFGYELIFEDNQHKGKLAATTAQKLLNIDKVDIVISLWDMADVIAPLTEQKQTPHLSIRWNPHIAENHKYTITVESTYRSYIDKTLELLEKLKAKKVGILTEEAEGWILASDYLKKTVRDHKIEIVGDERYPVDNPDHRGIVMRLLNKKPDIVVLLSNPPHTEILVQRIKEASPKQRFTGYFEYTDQPELIEGVPFAAQFAVAPWFEKVFESRFGTAMKARASHAYDIIKLISVVQGTSTKKLSGSELMARLGTIKNVPGASGTLNVSDTRTIESACVFKIVRNGKFEVIGLEELAKFDA